MLQDRKSAAIQVAVLGGGIALVVALGVVITPLVHPLPNSPTSVSKPIPFLVDTFYTFSGTYPTHRWQITGCPWTWGLPGQSWWCGVEVKPNDPAGTWNITAINSTPGGSVGPATPYLPIPCPGSQWTGIGFVVSLPSNQTTTLNLTIDFVTS